MRRYIDAERIDWRLIIPTNATTAEEHMIYQAMKLVEFQPTADVKPVVRGEWVEDGAVMKCSVCGNSSDHCGTENFCNYCGADMRERREDEI